MVLGTHEEELRRSFPQPLRTCLMRALEDAAMSYGQAQVPGADAVRMSLNQIPQILRGGLGLPI